MKQPKALVTGGAGSIGSELVKQLSKTHKVYILDTNETGVNDLIEEFARTDKWVYGRVGDIRDYATVEDVFADFKPDVVYHAAAYKHVSPMELTPKEAIDTNIMGTYNVLHNAKKFEVKKLIFISTDKAVNSTSVMGATKRVGEIMVRNQGYTAVRFGNVLGSRGSVITIWDRQVRSGRKITITDPNMTRYFMSVQDAVSLVIEAEAAEGGQILIMDMGPKVSILKLKEEYYGEYDYEIIGLRPGEALTESLMTEEEAKRAVKKGKFWYL